MKILFLESFFGGSHKDFALGLKRHSRHDITLMTLPDKSWKWRMKGAALYFLKQIDDLSKYDVIFTTDMMDLADFLSLAGKKCPPVIIYFHENQLSYPLAPKQKKDPHLSFINIISAAVADKVLFNSHFHLKAFIDAAEQLVDQMPDTRPRWIIDKIREKTEVVYPGCHFKKGSIKLKECDIDPPLIIWNHRWEYDKNPEFFFDVLEGLKKKNILFSLGLLGERPDSFPKVFTRAKEQFRDELVVCGYVESKEEYRSWLGKGAIVVSCAIQENFGISVVEAVRHGCIPLLPDRLSYPELMPDDFLSDILYRTKKELSEKLEHMLVHYNGYLAMQKKMSMEMERYSWEIIIKQYDDMLDKMTFKKVNNRT